MEREPPRPGKRAFRLEDFRLGQRLENLPGPQAAALAEVLAGYGPGEGVKSRFPDREALGVFLLPLAAFGLSADQMRRLAERMPEDWPLDHSRIYYDFRLDRWARHLEPPTLAECLEEYLENAESHAQGMAYLRGQWEAFVRRRAGV